MAPAQAQQIIRLSWTTILESFLPSYYLRLLYPLVVVVIPTLPPATSTAMWIQIPLRLLNKCMQTLAAVCFLSLLVLVYFSATSAYIWIADGYTSADADAPTAVELEHGVASTPTRTETPAPLALTLRTLLNFALNLSVVATYTLSRGVLAFESSAPANATAAGVFVLHGLAVLGVTGIAAGALSLSVVDHLEEQRRAVLDTVPGQGQVELSKDQKEFVPSLCASG
ncbi:hypothetical protein FB45DRAFT_1036343 [Roridomyces roridus]|uniref:Uncharacterized protein n=1 Tax=Roridomyces roridus TaxID=1738132 RepID=A0AAD7B7X5_9AGAR|nr:hypothetical protein FB45DRAFT_1036343 [Roridomyces roridus]